MKKKGFSIIELIVALAVIATAIVGVYGALALAVRASTKAADRTQAAFLLEEGFEAVRRLRDLDWTNNIFNKDPLVSYCIEFYNAGQSPQNLRLVSTNTSTAPLDASCTTSGTNFVRLLRFKKVCRNSDNPDKDKISAVTNNTCATGSYLDDDTRRVDVTVLRGASSETMQAYITNLFGQQ